MTSAAKVKPEAVAGPEGDFRRHWHLKRTVNLNHGSFGATPVAVLEQQEKLSREINADRWEFIMGDASARHEDARKALASFLRAPPDDLVFMDNVTEALHTVVKSLSLGAGDEVLVTNHMYGNYPAPLAELAARQGFRIVKAEIPFPVLDDEQIMTPVLQAATSCTKLAIIDHITSPTAVIFPVKRIVAALSERGIDTFVDGAHGAGMLDLDIPAIGAAYYGGNNHKWLCAPLASGFLHVALEKQAAIIPVVGSGKAARDVPFTERFAWQGTKDLTPRLMVPETIRTMASLHPQGWPGIYKRNHDLIMAARDMVAEAMNVKEQCPEHMTGSMVSIPLAGFKTGSAVEMHMLRERLYRACLERHGFGINVTAMDGQGMLRITAHLYNSMDEYEWLAEILPGLMKEFRSV